MTPVQCIYEFDPVGNVLASEDEAVSGPPHSHVGRYSAFPPEIETEEGAL